jgi:hypothetical protein
MSARTIWIMVLLCFLYLLGVLYLAAQSKAELATVHTRRADR